MRKPGPKERSAARRRQNRERKRERRVRARPVPPGRRYKITRRCFERRLYLTPSSPEVKQILGYLLGYCLHKYGLQLHAACFMGNHYHLDVTDVRGNFPGFKSTFNGLVARRLNAHRGRRDRFWSADRGCDVELTDDNDVIDRMSYTLANPVTAGLVPRATRWPSLTTAGMAFGDSMHFRRPSGFFDEKDGDMPASTEVELTRPNVMKGLTDGELHALLTDRVRVREQEAKAQLRKQKRRFMLESRIAKQHWNRKPRSTEERFKTTPTVAAGCKWTRIAALQRNREWEEAYADARDADVPGASPVYPFGTYLRRLYGGVRVAAAPS